MCSEIFSLYSFFSVSLSLTHKYIYISLSPTPLKWQRVHGDIIPKKLDLANFISSASCAPGSQPQQKKRNQWKCCIKPFIRVEHIRIILHAQSGSCYAAAYVVVLVPEFSTLICVLASVRINRKCSVCMAVFDLGKRLKYGCSSRCKACISKAHPNQWLKI